MVLELRVITEVMYCIILYGMHAILLCTKKNNSGISWSRLEGKL